MDQAQQIRWSLVIGLALGLMACHWESGSREPSAIGPAQPVKFPLKIVCAGPATSSGVFQFSGTEEGLSMEYSPSGEVRIKGKASILVRDRGIHSSFEGVVSVLGTRSADTNTYFLEGNTKNDRWVFELQREGASTLSRHRGNDVHSYLSTCTRNF